MIIERTHPDYEIRGLTYRKEAGNIRLRWRYKEAAEFLVFLYDSRQDFSLQAACEEIAAAGFSDAEIWDAARKLLPIGKDSFWKLTHRKKAEFVRDGRCMNLAASELKKEVPYGISVFACTFDTEAEQLHIYEAGTQENTCFLPVKVKVELRYKMRPFSKEKYCMLRLPRIDDYRDGAILYHVDGVDSDFPLPQSCMGRELTIVIPRRAQVSIRIREEDKKYYCMPIGYSMPHGYCMPHGV